MIIRDNYIAGSFPLISNKNYKFAHPKFILSVNKKIIVSRIMIEFV